MRSSRKRLYFWMYRGTGLVGVLESAICLCLLSFLSWGARAFAETPDPFLISLPEVSAVPGESLLIPVMVGDLSERGVIGVDLAIEYDADVLSTTGIVKAGTQTDAWNSSYNIVLDGSLGTLHVGLATDTLSAPGNGVLLFLAFEVSPSVPPGHSSPLHFAEAMLNERMGIAQDGMVVLGTVGDVSLNGQVTAFDASVILRFRVGSTGGWEYPGLDPGVADVDRSGEVTSLDAVYILQFVVGMIPQLPVPPEFLLFKPMAATRSIWLGTSEPSDDGLLVPIYVDDLTGILAGELRFSFAGAAIGVVPSEQTTDYLFASHASEGEARVAFAGATSGSGMGVLGYLRIDVPYAEFDAGALRLEGVVLNDGGMGAEVTEDRGSPAGYRLSQNRPNPFNPHTSIRYLLPVSERVVLSVYNVQGQLVRTLVNAFQSAGTYTVTWDGRDGAGRNLANGTYMYRMIAGEYRSVRKSLLLK